MGMVCLSHSQFEQPLLIQVADLFGGYTLTFAIVFFASSLLSLPMWTECCERKTSWWHTSGAIVSLCIVIAYGQYRLSETISSDESRRLAIGMIQGSVDTNLFDRSGELQDKFDQCCELTWQARSAHPGLDLIIWPESNFPIYDVIGPVENENLDEYDAPFEIEKTWRYATGFPEYFSEPAAMLVGTLGSYEGDQAYNSAALISDQGKIETRYFKNHRVMFGEYFPILEWIPAFARVFPNISAGDKPTIIDFNGVRLAPSICFETTVPHLIRRHINQLTEEGAEPDVLVNMTNDGWFYGTSCLDFHLACNVFRAVETRKTNLVCANTGLSAEIDTCGRILQRGPRRDTQILPVQITPQARSSIYRTIGDWIPFGMAICCLIGLVFGWRSRHS